MEQMCPRVKNYHVSVKEVDKTIVFLRKLERGGTEHSFGIHVARMAGMPASVVARAEEILKNLELVYGNNEIVPSKSPRRRDRKALPGVREAAEAGIRRGVCSFRCSNSTIQCWCRSEIRSRGWTSMLSLRSRRLIN